MKKFFKNFWLIISIIITIVIIVGCFAFGFFEIFRMIWDFILFIGGGYWVKGLLLLPFCGIGLIQIIRGIIEIMSKDINKYNDYTKKTAILLYIYIFFIPSCCLIFFFTILNL